jgi:DNA-binding Lrp family transcriptional regulator
MASNIHIMPLSEIESKVLGVLQLDPLQSAQNIAQQTKLSIRSVQHAIQRLRKRKTLRTPKPTIDRAALGITEYRLLYSFSGLTSKGKTALHSFIEKDSRIRFAAEIGGRWQLALSIATKETGELIKCVKDIGRIAGRHLHTQAISILSEFHLYPRKYLPRPSRAAEVFTSRLERAIVKIDSLDEQILEVLSAGEWDSFRSVAAQIKVAPATVLRRIESLRASGVILRFRTSINLTHLQRETFFILLYCPMQRADLTDRISTWTRNHPLVTALIEGVGNWSYEITVEGTSSADAQSISQELLDEFGDEISGIESLSLFRYLKVGRYKRSQ